VTIASNATLKDALSLMLAHKHSTLRVEDENGLSLGEIRLSDIIARPDAS
jgi:CBS domain-containing protein